MRIGQTGEFSLIEEIRKKMEGRYSPRVSLGIGDDCAVLVPEEGKELIVSTDTFVEKIHFDLAWFSFYQIGWRAMAAALSDIAAMGGAPLGALLGCSVSVERDKEEVIDLVRGVRDLGLLYDCPLVGGDLTRSPGELFVNVTVLGEVDRGKALCRAGAEEGDEVWVTGFLGASHAGLKTLLRSSAVSREAVRDRTDRYLQPTPRIREACFLANLVSINSMIDLSDGLSSDLGHICSCSGLGALIFSSSLPISPETKEVARSLREDSLDYALNGGEDFELCFTAGEGRIDPWVDRFREAFGLSLTRVGRMVRDEGLILIDSQGRKKDIQPRGFDHFLPV
mgnify:CR=1 FL=1